MNDDLPEEYTFREYGTDGELIFSGKDLRDSGDAFVKGLLGIEDDDVEVEVIQFDVSDIMPEIMAAVAEDFPRLAELFLAKRQEQDEPPQPVREDTGEGWTPSSEVRRILGLDDPPAEGDWELPADDRTGEDL